MVRPLIFSLGLSLCAVPVLAQPDPAPPAKTSDMMGTPTQQIEGTIRAFASDLSGDGIYFRSLNTVANMEPFGYFGGPEWATRWEKKRGSLRLEVEKIEVVDLKENTATAHVSYSWHNSDLHVRSQPIAETINLKLDAAQGTHKAYWKIVPPQSVEEAEKLVGVLLAGADGIPVVPDNAPILNECAARLAHQGTWFLETPNEKESRANLKQLALAAIEFTQDYDENFAFAPQFYKEALAPYALQRDIWTIPAIGEPYTFNANLSGHSSSYARLTNRNRVVLFYEGENETPVFRYDGRAAIAFVDGHVALVTPDEAKNLIWKP